MAQGAIKKSKAAPSSSRRPSAPGAKKGQRTIAPKKRNLVSQKKITKVGFSQTAASYIFHPAKFKYTAGLTGKTERLLAEKVGHLEMLSGTRKKGNAGEGVKGKGGK